MTRKRISIFMIIVMSLLYLMPYNTIVAETKVTATYKSIPFVVDGILEEGQSDAYLINKSTYVRIKDIAYLLWNTDKQFYLDWNFKSNIIKLTSGKSNSFFAGEMYQKNDTKKKIASSISYKIYLDEKEIKISAYAVDGDRYFKLTDFAEKLDFSLIWDVKTGKFIINTTRGYVKNEKLPDGKNLGTDKEAELYDAGYLGLVPEKLQKKMDSNITRLEFCGLILKAFFIIDGRKQDMETADTKTFSDTKNKTVLMAYSAELIKNNKNKTFRPSDLITKEEAVGMMMYFIDRDEYYWKIESQYLNTDSILYADDNEIPESIKDDVYNLKASKILIDFPDNQFDPKSNMTAEDAVIMIKRLCREFKPDRNEITIGGKSIALGMDTDALIKEFGKPQRVKYDSQHIKYVYNSNPEDFFIAGICQNKVIYIYTNAKSFLFNNKSFGSYNISYYYTHGTCEWGKFQFFKDTNADFRIMAVELQTYCTDESHGNEFHLEKDFKDTALEWEQDIFDMTNAFRVCYGLSPLQWDDALAQIARNHSYEMSTNGFISHYSLDGRSPFDRMSEVGITYQSASENAAYLSDYYKIESYEMFHGWVNSEGHRENILTPDLTHLGVGVAIAMDTSEEYFEDNVGYWATQDFIETNTNISD